MASLPAGVGRGGEGRGGDSLCHGCRRHKADRVPESEDERPEAGHLLPSRWPSDSRAPEARAPPADLGAGWPPGAQRSQGRHSEPGECEGMRAAPGFVSSVSGLQGPPWGGFSLSSISPFRDTSPSAETSWSPRSRGGSEDAGSERRGQLRGRKSQDRPAHLYPRRPRMGLQGPGPEATPRTLLAAGDQDVCKEASHSGGEEPGPGHWFQARLLCCSLRPQCTRHLLRAGF